MFYYTGAASKGHAVGGIKKHDATRMGTWHTDAKVADIRMIVTRHT
jgi:hypothetical protein